MRKAAALAIALMITMAAASSDAEDAPSTTPATKVEDASLQGYAAQAPQCLEWSDGCAVCARESATAAAHCSTPGVACQPNAIQCSKP
jgi:hypothetical protein